MATGYEDSDCLKAGSPNANFFWEETLPLTKWLIQIDFEKNRPGIRMGGGGPKFCPNDKKQEYFNQL